MPVFYFPSNQSAYLQLSLIPLHSLSFKTFAGNNWTQCDIIFPESFLGSVLQSLILYPAQKVTFCAKSTNTTYSVFLTSSHLFLNITLLPNSVQSSVHLHQQSNQLKKVVRDLPQTWAMHRSAIIVGAIIVFFCQIIVRSNN